MVIQMRNAKDEFIEQVGDKKVVCASITKGYSYKDNNKKFVLKVGYSDSDYEEFLKQLDFNYSNGFGGQELDGIILYEDGVWSERGEYDGSEWWETHKYPNIPKECKEKGDTNEK